MIGTPQEIRAELRQHLLESYQTEYDDHLAAWRALEAKAQLAITISGVFLAAALAFVRDLSGNRLHVLELLLLCGALVFLVTAIVCGLYVFKMAIIQTLPLGTFSHQRISDVVAQPDDKLEEYATRYAIERAAQWQKAIQDLKAVNEVKAEGVVLSQVFLVLAIGSTTAFTIWEILK